LDGWGFTYYEVTGPRAAAGTLMAVPEGAEPVRRFVSAPSRLIPYNSRLPVVVYAPEGYEVRYRIWEAGKETFQAAQR
jgi:ecotin